MTRIGGRFQEAVGSAALYYKSRRISQSALRVFVRRSGNADGHGKESYDRVDTSETLVRCGDRFWVINEHLLLFESRDCSDRCFP